MASKSLLAAPPRVLNVGLRSFADDLAARGIAVAHVDWRPPVAGREKAANVLSWLSKFEKKIHQANEEGLRAALELGKVYPFTIKLFEPKERRMTLSFAGEKR